MQSKIINYNYQKFNFVNFFTKNKKLINKIYFADEFLQLSCKKNIKILKNLN